MLKICQLLNLQKQKNRKTFFFLIKLKKSGKRDSDSRPQPWQGCALPTELLPHCMVHFSKCDAKVVLFVLSTKLYGKKMNACSFLQQSSCAHIAFCKKKSWSVMATSVICYDATVGAGSLKISLFPKEGGKNLYGQLF